MDAGAAPPLTPPARLLDIVADHHASLRSSTGPTHDDAADGATADGAAADGAAAGTARPTGPLAGYAVAVRGTRAVVKWQHDLDLGASAGGRSQLDGAAVRVDNAFDDGQAQARTGHRPAVGAR